MTDRIMNLKKTLLAGLCLSFGLLSCTPEVVEQEGTGGTDAILGLEGDEIVFYPLGDDFTFSSLSYDKENLKVPSWLSKDTSDDNNIRLYAPANLGRYNNEGKVEIFINHNRTSIKVLQKAVSLAVLDGTEALEEGESLAVTGKGCMINVKSNVKYDVMSINPEFKIVSDITSEGFTVDAPEAAFNGTSKSTRLIFALLDKEGEALPEYSEYYSIDLVSKNVQFGWKDQNDTSKDVELGFNTVNSGSFSFYSSYKWTIDNGASSWLDIKDLGGNPVRAAGEGDLAFMLSPKSVNQDSEPRSGVIVITSEEYVEVDGKFMYPELIINVVQKGVPTFDVEVDESSVTFSSTQVNVYTDEGVTWYGFVTTEKDIVLAAENRYWDLYYNRPIDDLKTGPQTFTIDNLEPDTEYSYVVFCVTSEGERYGEPASAEFTTDCPTFSLNVDESTVTDVSVQVEVTTDGGPANTWYGFVTTNKNVDQAVEEKYWELYYSGYIDGLKAQSQTVTVENLLPGVEYVYIVFGLTYDGRRYGEPVSVEFKTTVSTYATWLGDWTWTGANGVAFDVTFIEDVYGESYLLSGWEGVTDTEFLIPVIWNKADNTWMINVNYLGIMDSDLGEARIYVCGYTSDSMLDDSQDLPICMGRLLEDGRMICDQISENPDFIPMTFIYFARIGDQPYWVTDYRERPTFPITITPRSKSAGSSINNTGDKVFPLKELKFFPGIKNR